jgi:hypothetical protein
MKITENVYMEIHYEDLNEFVSGHYGFDYDVVLDMEWGNDQKRDAYADDTWEDGDDRELEFKEWIGLEAPDGSYMLDSILTDLCIKGLIKKGNYLIDVWW